MKKRFLCLMLIFSLILSCVNIPVLYGVDSDTETPIGVVIGDSIAEGNNHSRLHSVIGYNQVQDKFIYGADLSVQNSVGQISYYLENSLGFNVYNHGITSERTDRIKQRWGRDVLAETNEVLTPTKTLDKKPYFVVMICGINDIVFPGRTSQIIEDNLEYMIDSAVENGIKPIVLNLGIRVGIMDEERTMLKEVNAWLETKKAETPQMTLIDYRAFSTIADNTPNTTYIRDGLHPNDLGYSELANKIINEGNLMPVTGIVLNKTAFKINVAKTIRLTATILPANAANKEVVWTSSNTKIATVSSTGYVTGKYRGVANINATTVDGSKIASCRITVIQPVKRVTLNKKIISIKKGRYLRLFATVYPTNANNKRVYWRTSNKRIAAVTYKGTVKGIRRGIAYIRVYTVDGKKTARCKVTIK